MNTPETDPAAGLAFRGRRGPHDHPPHVPDAEELHIKFLELPQQAGWSCQLFGCGTAIVIRPNIGQVPNRFWRFMQWLAFGNRWIKDAQP